ncbi:MAG: integrase [Nostoc sp. NMS7]|uniref:integrase n=1 Tax=Nostoc sp. NMS7 TaxID=2815391 RepID=UPI0025F1E049|nr:integrase [Nostoc sp. NMS7]MBN3951898.1 integrase [Nostoc sp. NMS7]
MKWTIEAVNERLKAGKIGVRVEQRGDRLSLRATLPPKSGSNKTKPYQQYLALGIYANPAGLQRAEAEAKIVGGLLARGEFDWSRYLVLEQELASGDWGTWIDKLRNDYFAQKGDTPNTQFTWKNDYEAAFKNLKGEVAIASLIAAATCTAANSRSRKRTCEKLQILAELTGIKVDLKPYIGNYGNAQTKPRQIPTDDEIIRVRSLFDNSPNWLWAYGVMATYGLRDHEIFFREISPTSPHVCHVIEGKTGERICYPLHPEWSAEWQLWEIKKPNCTGKMYRDYGQRVSRTFDRKDVSFLPYDLRHAYAIRGSVRYKAPVATMAAWMGHSPTVHWNTYNKWISQVEHAKVFEGLQNRSS